MNKYFKTIALGMMFALLIGGAAFAANVSIEEKQDIVQNKVNDGSISEEAAEGFLSELQARMAECEQTCDGTPNIDRERLGQKYGIGGFGFGKNTGEGNGAMNGQRGNNGLRTSGK
jgi:hypothetical protein